MIWIQNDNQNVDESINTPKLDSHYYLFIGDILFITLHSFNAVLCLMIVFDYMWSICCFSFFLTCVFLVILYSRCVLDNNENTDSRSTSIAQIYLEIFYISQVYLNAILSTVYFWKVHKAHFWEVHKK